MGPSPLWSSWNAFVRGDGRAALGIGTSFIPDHDFYADLWPVEPLLLHSQVPTVVACGSDDIYCTREYVEYLWQRAVGHGRGPGERSQAFGVIRGCPHTVRGKTGENIGGYLDVVFDVLPEESAMSVDEAPFWRVVHPITSDAQRAE